jgi:hypothetical protein
MTEERWITSPRTARSRGGFPARVTELPALRKRVFGILWPLAHGKRPARSALDALNADRRKWSARWTIAGGEGGFTFQEEAADPIGRTSSRVIATTAELLPDVRPLRVRETSLFTGSS